jgi:CheY-like chemotaxis protein
MHDGRITIASAGAGKGTEVEIRLPLTSMAPASAVATRQMLATPGTNLRVLIVEDNRDAAEMLEFAVSSLGYATQVAHDGASAVSVARSFEPDVVFLDIGLPVMNGYEVARELRGSVECRNVYIAAVTGWGQDEDRRKARDAGCDSHFTKPLSPTTVEELLATIATRLHEGRPANASPRTRRADSIAPE